MELERVNLQVTLSIEHKFVTYVLDKPEDVYYRLDEL